MWGKQNCVRSPLEKGPDTDHSYNVPGTVASPYRAKNVQIEAWLSWWQLNTAPLSSAFMLLFLGIDNSVRDRAGATAASSFDSVEKRVLDS